MAIPLGYRVRSNFPVHPLISGYGLDDAVRGDPTLFRRKQAAQKVSAAKARRPTHPRSAVRHSSNAKRVATTGNPLQKINRP
ncbi:MAG: hypothetical protein AB7O71_19005 [Hyphomicrobiaceae bacterium]